MNTCLIYLLLVVGDIDRGGYTKEKKKMGFGVEFLPCICYRERQD